MNRFKGNNVEKKKNGKKFSVSKREKQPRKKKQLNIILLFCISKLFVFPVRFLFLDGFGGGGG
jgi:hypothetical protein